MQRLRPRGVIGIAFFVLVLMIGVKVAAIVTADPQPPLPPLLQGLRSSGGSTTVCPPASEQEAVSRPSFPVSPIGWSSEFGRRLEHEFPPGSEAKLMTDQLQKLGFTMAAEELRVFMGNINSFDEHGNADLDHHARRPSRMPPEPV